MLEYCFLSLGWNLDPVGVDRPFRNGSRTILTCSQPIAKVVEREPVYASSPNRRSDPLEVAWWLKRWEQFTSEFPQLSRSKSEELNRTIQQEFNEHTAAATVQLVGPVRVDRLTDIYDWTIAERNDERIILEATPRDEMDRLFYRSLRISLTQEDGSPVQISVTGRNLRQQIVWKSDAVMTSDSIRLVRFEEAIPPTPKPLVRTANLRND